MRSKGDMASAFILWVALLASCSAVPMRPLPNITSVDLGLKEGSCALGDVVYMPGDEFPGAGPCERCSCADGSVSCSKQRCEPRAGCKAVHRPDHCCPTYQCECEQEGRVYGNGEKLVDPQDPCKVCYCQGGEVVCRRIACFVRDDCRPRLVPGRCCPEYDNCPLRGVTTLTGLSPIIPSTSAVENIDSGALPSPPNENIKQEITIKEITPVSEIPVITDVKIKEILPSSAMEVAEYSSSKSPLITREATSEKSVNEENAKTEAPPVIEPSVSTVASSELPSSSSNDPAKTKSSNDPSKISLSTQDTISSEMYPPILSSIATMGAGSIIPDAVLLTTKAPIIEDEDLSAIDHNPLFPPIPDDLTVSSNHEDEIVQQEQNLDSDHMIDVHEIVSVSSSTTPTEAPFVKELLTTTMPSTTDSLSSTQDISSEVSLSKESILTTESSKETSSRENSMLNLRSAIPIEILSVPALVAESVTEEPEESTGMPVTDVTDSFDSSPEIIIGPETVDIREESLNIPVLNVEKDFISSTEIDIPYSDSTYKPEDMADVTSSHESQDPTTNSISKSNVGTEITSQTELSSIPIETSDQNPHEASEKLAKDKNSTSTLDPALLDASTTTKLLPVTSEEITVPKVVPSDNNESFDNGETTEFILTSFDSSESVTEPVELIKISTDKEKSSAIIEPSHGRNNNVLTDLINLVGDVASISDHTESSEIEHPTTSRTTISDYEELLPVNSGYKSKNNNRNQNSITEIPFKNKAPVGNKQKVVEIEDEDTDSITDSPPPHDKVEPTTRRPIIDNVSDDVKQGNKTEKVGKKDIEIITQSYVPTINRRPTKVVLKKSNEKPVSEEVTTEGALKFSTESNVNLVSDATVAPVFAGSSSETEEKPAEDADDKTTPAQ